MRQGGQIIRPIPHCIPQPSWHCSGDTPCIASSKYPRSRWHRLMGGEESFFTLIDTINLDYPSAENTSSRLLHMIHGCGSRFKRQWLSVRQRDRIHTDTPSLPQSHHNRQVTQRMIRLLLHASFCYLLGPLYFLFFV